jgi:glycosyltransferase involved in cell wall biosynthesis
VRVVFLTHNYPRTSGDLPGMFLAPLARALRERGHDVRVVAPADRGRGGRDELDGIPVRRVRYAAPGRETYAYTGTMQEAVRSPGGLLALAGMIRALRAGARAEVADPGPPARLPAGPTVVHCHWWFPAGLASPPELPAVVTLHGTDGRLLEKSALARALGRRVLRRARIVTAVSPGLARTARSVAGRPDVSERVQPMPVDTSGYSWSRGGGGLGVVARLTAQKRVNLAIQTAARLADQGNPLPLTIVGDGAERRALERLAASHPAAPIRFAGHLSPPEVLRVLAGADAMLFTAEQEGFGLAAIEGLMCGVPVVGCKDGGGIVWALDRFGGGVLAPGQPMELAQAVQEVITPEFRAQVRIAGERWRAELAPARVAQVFEGWYEAALRA